MPTDDWAAWRRSVDLDGYDERWARMAEAGDNPHGEADLVSRFAPSSVLDAGCGTGRVAIELARRSIDVVGVDLDPDLLARARAKAPDLTWVEVDLSQLDLGRTFDVVVAAGNVVGFVAELDRPAAVARCAAHVAADGHLIAGWQLRPGWPTVTDHDGWCAAAGLVLVDHFATWAADPLATDPDYVVAVHRRPA